jgi:AraC-like DNA-binding protein
MICTFTLKVNVSCNSLTFMSELIFSLTPVYVTAFWAIVLNFNHINKHRPKVFLGRFMIVSTILYLSHFYYFTRQLNIYYFLDGFYLMSSLLVFPLYHIYIRLLTTEHKFSFQKHGRFLILPLAVFVFYYPATLMMPPSDHSYFILHIFSFGQMNTGLQQYLFIIYYIARAVFVFQVFFYLYLNFKLITENNKRLEDFYSNTEDRKLVWVQFFNISLAATSLVSIAAALTGREAFASGEYSLAGPSVVFSSMLFILGLLGNRQNSVYINMEEAEHVSDKDNLKYTDIEAKIRMDLDELMNKKQIFKNPDLKIWDLSKMLGTNRTYISRFINNEYDHNFNNHINLYRVNFAKNKLLEDPGLSNEQLSEMAGFGSVSSLYRAFQAAEGKSFSVFRKAIRRT